MAVLTTRITAILMTTTNNTNDHINDYKVAHFYVKNCRARRMCICYGSQQFTIRYIIHHDLK